jgi:squalene-associated FAD-dependent desaturase
MSMSVRVAIVGGGLAGLATAVALAGEAQVLAARGVRLEIDLFESRRQLGGRATSYVDAETGETIDNCQHVSLGCCTNFDDFCRRTGASQCLTTVETLRFLGPDRRVYLLSGMKCLPAPLHLAPSLLGLGYLSLRERVACGFALRRLARMAADADACETIDQWLRKQGQSERAIELFWTPVIVSALAEEPSRVSLSAARKVFVDAFVRTGRGYVMRYPAVSLLEFYDRHIQQWLERNGVRIHVGRGARRVLGDASTATGVEFSDGERRDFDRIVVAIPWFRTDELFAGTIRERLRFLNDLHHFEASPITSVHLWFDRVLFEGDHLVLPGRFSQWIFRKGLASSKHYFQAVISGSRELVGMPRDEVVRRVQRDIGEFSSSAREARLIAAKVITEQRAVFSPRPGVEAHRPSQQTEMANLFMAGDWTATGWPATMEGAVRSGYLAAEALLRSIGVDRKILVGDLAASRWSRWLMEDH